MNFKIKFYNSLTASKQEFFPLEEDLVKMYVCGPTVYDRPHLGNARSIVIYDLLYRLLLQIYKKVIYVRNITDVDDKINARAKELNIPISKLTQNITDLFHQDILSLNTLVPDHEPLATNHINDMIVIIQKLIANNHAYVQDSHVLFAVDSYSKYGQLSRRNLDQMIAGSRVEIANYKKNPLDFVLWKPAQLDDDESTVFSSPWGKGRPGWHIECSAMSTKYLGENFDIHGGGADLQFPHHENEIAQSCCANPQSNYAKFWIHNGFLTVNGEKMSKSLKNFITVYDLLSQGISGIAIRLMLLTTHYRKPFDFNSKALSDAQKTTEKFKKIIDESFILFESQLDPKQKFNLFCDKNFISNDIIESLCDDLNFSKTLAILHDLAKNVKNNSNDITTRKILISSLDFLGLVEK
jgi:cysteinyl-tRNA synthetase